MKRILCTAGMSLALLLPVSAHAYFVDHFQYQRPSVPGYVQDPSLDFLPGWPDWIGRLNVFSQYLYGRKYQDLTETQRVTVEKLSKNWPDWIGVPSFLRR